MYLRDVFQGPVCFTKIFFSQTSNRFLFEAPPTSEPNGCPDPRISSRPSSPWEVFGGSECLQLLGMNPNMAWSPKKHSLKENRPKAVWVGVLDLPLVMKRSFLKE